MGTIVLSPQDYLSSPHDRRNYHFPSDWRIEAGRRCSQASMVPLPAAEDCARLDHSGGSPPGDGLLPIPQPYGHTRALSKRPPFPAKTPSIFCTPPARRTTAASHSPTVQPKLSRSASAILPTPLTGSPLTVEGDGLHLLKGRLPLKVVQGNGPGSNSTDVVQHSNSKKPIDARNASHKKIATPNRQAVNAKVKGNLDGLHGLRSTLKLHQDGTALKEQPKKFDVRNQRSLARSHSFKGPREKHVQGDEIPVITILQRPQNKEAAVELLTKFFQNRAKQETLCLNDECADCPPEDLWNSHDVSMGVRGERLCQNNPSPRSSTTNVSGAVANKLVGESPLADAAHLTVSSTIMTKSDAATFNSPKGPLELLESVSEELASWERWAGPSFINSPPPSALPLPRFSRKHGKIEPLAVADLFEEKISDQASTLPSSMSPLYACFSGQRKVGMNSAAVVSATKDLKRILNLDLSRM